MTRMKWIVLTQIKPTAQTQLSLQWKLFPESVLQFKTYLLRGKP